MVVYFSVLLLHLQIVNIGEKKNLKEGDEQIKNHPNINHLDVGSAGETGADADKEGDQDKHCCHINSYCWFKEERFELASIIYIVICRRI